MNLRQISYTRKELCRAGEEYVYEDLIVSGSNKGFDFTADLDVGCISGESLALLLSLKAALTEELEARWNKGELE